jgi:hypothetical protein
MPEAEETTAICPNKAEIGRQYRITINQVRIMMLVQNPETKRVYLKDKDIIPKNEEKVIAVRDLLANGAKLDNIGGYNLLLSHIVFRKEGSDEEFLIPNLPCLTPVNN